MSEECPREVVYELRCRYAENMRARVAELEAVLHELMTVAGEGNKFGRAIDLIPRKSIDRANAVLAKGREG